MDNLEISFNDELDKIFNYFSSQNYLQRLAVAKKAFIEFAGPFDEDRLDVESKWIQFRDWYLFDFTFENQTCIDILKQVSDQIVEPEILESISAARLSVFYYYKESKGWLYFRDLITRDKIYIKDTVMRLILEKDDYIQTRLFYFNKEYYIGAHLTAHHPDARKYIDSKIKVIRKEKNPEIKEQKKKDLLDLLFKKYFQIQRFKQVDVRKIYSDEPLFERKVEERL